ncbi:MAG: FAD-dependent oxidoreductase [Planctomycetota bacterium]
MGKAPAPSHHHEGEAPVTVREPAREVPVLGTWDVVVCGGGPAGCAAAIGAARHGARTLLVEKQGHLGGATVDQIVAVVLSTNGVDFQGIWHEYARRLYAREAMRPLEGVGEGQIRSCVDPEQVKFVWDELLSEAGVEILHHVLGCTCHVEAGVAAGVIAETRAGRRAILAERVIDATGDGIVAAESGVGFDQGDGEHKYAMALTKVLRLGGLPDELPRPDEETMARLADDLAAAVARGDYDAPVVTEQKRLLNYIRAWCWRLPRKRREILSVISRVLKVDPLDPFDFTRAEREGREQARQAADFLCRYVPGLEQAYLLDTSAQIGLRSSRRLHGLATVTAEDAMRFRKHPDSIARSSWNIDIWPADSYSAPAVDHSSDEARERREQLLAGEYFDIPYGCIVAAGADHLLMAGRCISAEHVAESSLRIQQTCMATGEAAGVAAALSLRERVSPRELDPALVVRQLAADRDVEPAFDSLRNIPIAPRKEPA